MEKWYFVIVYFALVLLQTIIRLRFLKRYKISHQHKIAELKPKREKYLVDFVRFSYFIPSLVWGVTSLLDFADLHLTPLIRIIGFFVAGVGVYIFYIVHKHLGDNWSPVLEIRPKHELIVSGIYRYVRHPMYSSMLLMVVGHSLIASNWIVILFLFFSTMLLFIIRIPDEEKLMIQEFGEEYKNYKKLSKMLIPFLI